MRYEKAESEREICLLLRRRRNFERVQTREVPEVLFNRDVKRISDLVADPVLRAFAGGICVFGGRKGVPPASRSARNLFVCVLSLKKCRPLLEQLDGS